MAQGRKKPQQEYLKDILQINVAQDHRHAISRRITVQDSTWLDWLHRTGELPPDFDKMPSRPFLPEPLTILKNGKDYPVKTPAEWQEKREWIKEQFQYWISGKVPPAPDNLQVKVLSDKKEGTVRIQTILLRFGPDHKAQMTLELMILEGTGPLPVFMTQWTHRNWAQLAVRRGYIGCVYAAADSKDDTQAYQQLYPGYDFTALMRRAWGASRVVDYLLTRPEVNKNQIAITGHSRNGKQSLWAAAFDDRIAAVITSSCGTGGITPFRYSDPQYCNQTIDDICSNAAHWFHPRLRFFFGREDKLPIDQNLLLALIAPRALLMHYSIVERQLNPWANEQTYQSVKKVYGFLGAEEKIGVLTRMGEHAVATRDVEKTIDYLDIQFKRSRQPWVNNLYYNYTFEDWQKNNGHLVTAKPSPVVLQKKYADTTAYQAQRKEILNRLNWLLGPEPSGVKPAEVAPTDLSRVDWIDGITGRPKVSGAKVVHIGPYTAIGDHLSGMLYLPEKAANGQPNQPTGKVPVVIYLHQYAYAHGFAFGYDKERGNGNSKLFQDLINRGIAVFAMDMFGFGTRNQEAPYFYQRFPAWSKMGKMVSDVKACVDALETFATIDKSKIFLLGNTIGGSVAIMAAAQDSRIAGVAAVAAFSPWRKSNAQYESLRNYSHLHGFMPRLGFYAGQPATAPVDFAEIMSCIAPRPLLLISPELDRHADLAAVKQSVQAVAGVYRLYNQPQHLQLQTPREINRLTTAMHPYITAFFKSISSKPVPGTSEGAGR
ncbi:hypothetical protein AAE02nite_49520 [Adhaeribacter aerolatus]|uniref:Uncharacterized protein n=2 Tax=Adhaeribacter aerolatus TaxID=670289 RepID=A0A512B5P8_9BACT|nr:hypothetical protein AAE02nite_49520 [Adhaeribacter aerolatus]